MTSPKRTYYSNFIFSLAGVVADLEVDAIEVKAELAKQGIRVDEESIIIAWVMFQLERHLYLHMQAEGQHALTHVMVAQIGLPFFHRHEAARDALLSQIRPILTHGASVPYTDRVCKAEIRLPDLRLNFL